MNDEVLVLADRNGVIRFWSGGAERIFGYSSAEAAGGTLDLIVPPQYREAHWKGFRRAVESGEASAEGRPGPFPAQCANGEVVVIAGRLTLVREPGGGVVGAVVAFDPATQEDGARDPG